MKMDISFEQAMARLDEIVGKLDSGENTLEESLKLYGEGAELIAFCEDTLETAKLKIETLFPGER
ncbi:MAG: exodeoxyribonuclease VII small subunit [Oscillospiraceae bacterium]|nr:exodeoxyribonuclease VII small subunit [Oscillospiraceae bacterium]